MNNPSNRAVTLTLALSVAATGPQLLALGLLMPDISSTLSVPIILLGQLNTIFSIVAIVTSIAMGLLAVKYSPRSLLITGISTLIIGLVGASLSPSYDYLILFYIIYGVGLGLVIPISNLLMVLFPKEQRTTVLGRVYSGRSLTSIIATPIIGVLTASYGWRIGYVGFGLPLMTLALTLILTKIPQQSRAEPSLELTKGFRDIISNRSAVACLLASILVLVFFTAFMVYNGTYLRKSVGYSIEIAAVIMSLNFITIAIGQISSGSLASRIGVKRAVYAATFLYGLSLLAYFSFNLPSVASILFSLVGTVAAGVAMTTLSILALGQVPRSSGTMVSMVNAGISMGSMLGSALGGLAIDILGFQGFGVVMFTTSLISAIIFVLWTKEN